MGNVIESVAPASGSVNSRSLVVVCCVVLVTHIRPLDGLKCVCNPLECDVIRADDCPGKGYTVWDPCK